MNFFNKNNDSVWFNASNAYVLIFFLITLIYSCSTVIFSSSYLVSHSITIAWLIFLCIYFIKVQKLVDLSVRHLIFFPIAMNLAFWLGSILAGDRSNIFFIFDTYNNFLPKAAQLVNFFNFGMGNIAGKISWANHFLFFDLVNAIFIYFFNQSEFILMMTLALYKSIVVYYIFKTSCLLFDRKYAIISVFVYLLNPLFIMHTTLVFKEAFIHAVWAAFIYYLLLLFNNPKSIKLRALLILIAIMGMWERIYLVLPFSFSMIFFEFYFLKKNGKLLYILIPLCIFFALGLIMLNMITTFPNALAYLKSTRDFYSTYDDVNKSANYEIGFVVGFLKLAFSPYFTLNKLKLFKDFSNVIIWGSFAHQLMLVMAYLGAFFKGRKRIYEKAIVGQMFIHILFVSYIAPYGFRQRDSLAPLLAIWSPLGAMYILQKIKELKNNSLSFYYKRFSSNFSLNYNNLKKSISIFLLD